jgi:hypothetical protein
MSNPTTKQRNSCPKTITGKHIFIREVYVAQYQTIPVCELCGIYDDRKKKNE